MPITIEDFMKRATKEQKELLFKISDLVEEEKRYANQINAIKRSMESGIYRDCLAVTVCEDEDDAAVISAGPRQNLDRVRKQIGQLYQRAVKMGMRDLGIIQRHYEHYVGEPLLTD